MYSGGYTGAILRIDLSNRKISVEENREEMMLQYFGGRGLNSRFLYDEVPKDADPLGPKNKVYFGLGPLNGTLAPGSSRFTVSSKSPLTGAIGDGNGGGYFGAELKYAGYDMLVVEGQSEEPVYVYVEDDNIEIRDAAHLWGKSPRDTMATLRREVGYNDLGICTIGPAGENLVRFAVVVTDVGRTAARTGVGAVMGSKKLKAVVVRGTRGLKVADQQNFKKLVKEMVEAHKVNETFHNKFCTYGWAAFLALYNDLGCLPTYNYQQGTFEKIEDIKHDKLLTLSVKKRACFSCPIACSYTYAVGDGQYKGALSESIQLGPHEHMTSRIGNNDNPLLVKIFDVCNSWGVDAMDMAAAIGMVMECYQRGILTSKDIGGLKAEWGNHEAILKMIEMTSQRRGFGNILADGLVSSSKAIGKGAEKFAIHVKGMALSTSDPRAGVGWGFAYATASRGGDHCRCFIFGERVHDDMLAEKFEKYNTDPFAMEGKAELVAWHENIRAAQSSLELCIFTSQYGKLLMPEFLSEVFNAATGLNISADDFYAVGERIINVERAFNVREGFSRKDDTLPERFLKEPIPDGPAKGRVHPLEPMLDEYYKYRDWDQKTGYPTRKKLESLNLKDIANDLEEQGRLG